MGWPGGLIASLFLSDPGDFSVKRGPVSKNKNSESRVVSTRDDGLGAGDGMTAWKPVCQFSVMLAVDCNGVFVGVFVGVVFVSRTASWSFQSLFRNQCWVGNVCMLAETRWL